MYLQIIEQVKLRVAVGDWQPGHKIPSIREMAVSLRISVITVKRAYMDLEREQVIVTQQGKGSFIASGSSLGSKLQDQELDKHLEKAVKVAVLMGLNQKELETRLSAVHNQVLKEQS